MKKKLIKKSRYLLFFLSVVLNIFIVQLTQYLYSQNAETVQDRIKKHIMFLAGDELEGRYPATQGNVRAAEYIESYYKTMGLKPVNGSYRQDFDFAAGIKVAKESNMQFEMIVEKPGIPRDMLKPSVQKWEVGKDWLPVRFSENGTAKGELAFVGYGVTADDIKYDDYEGIDVKGKIVIILTDSSEGHPKDNQWAPYASLRYKATNARDHGAAAVIFVKWQSDSSNVFYSLHVERFAKNSGIVVIQSNRTNLAKFFPKNMQLYPSEMEINKTKKPKSFVLPNVTVSITVKLEEDQKQIPNMLAEVDGTDASLSNEFIFVGAHFDHLGWGTENSLYRGKTPMIHNGADDNASGTAAVLELASRFKKNPIKRPVIFMNFNAEEEGLVGSNYYVNNPIIPLEKTVAMFNLDMVGRMKNNKVEIFGTGSSSNFNHMIDSLGQVDSVTVGKISEGFSPSDHSSFYKKRVPVLFFFTGLHDDYHRPSDDWDKINYEGEAKVIDFAEQALRTVGNFPTKPDYILVTNPAKDAGDTTTNITYGNVWFGIVPNFEDNPKGFKISGTSAGSPAQKAGLKEDDIIMKFGDKVMKNIYDFTYALKNYKPGDLVNVVVLRGEMEMIFKVKLEKKK